MEARLNEAEAESSEFESRGEELRQWGESMRSENKKLASRLEAQNVQIQEIGVVAARHSQASHDASERAEQLGKKLEELGCAHEEASSRLERAERELESLRAYKERAERELRGSERFENLNPNPLYYQSALRLGSLMGSQGAWKPHSPKLTSPNSRPWPQLIRDC